MADAQIAQGHVLHWYEAEAKEGKTFKPPARCYVGGVELSVWRTIKDEEGDSVKNPLLAELKGYAEAGTPVRVKYESEPSKDGKFTNNTPKGVTTEGVDPAEVEKGDKASEEAKAKRGQGGFGKKTWQPRDESPVASRWATSVAVELAGEGVDLTATKVKTTIAKTAKALIEIASEVEMHAKDLWAKRGKAAGPQNKAADAEPEKKEVPADAF